MKLEAGKHYRLQNGMTVGPMLEFELEDPDRFYVNEPIDGFLPLWREDGTSSFFSVHDENEEYYIIAEVP